MLCSTQETQSIVHPEHRDTVVREGKSMLLVTVPLFPIPLLLQTHNNLRVELSKKQSTETDSVGVIFREVFLIYFD